MSLELNIPSIDLESALAGTWHMFQPGVEFLIARSGNSDYRKAVNAMYKSNKRAIDNQTMSNEQSDALMNDILSKHILKGWRGLQSGGKELPYSTEAAFDILSDERYLELRAWIVDVSGADENFRSEETKKLQTP